MSGGDKPDAWMPLYVGDWDSGTRHLTCEEDGAYGRLVRHYWRNGPPADDDGQLARIAGVERAQWRRLRPVLEAFFQIVDGRWRHKRVEAELVAWTEKRRRAIERAAAGGRARAARSRGRTDDGDGGGREAGRRPATSTAQARREQCTSASASAAGDRAPLTGGLSPSDAAGGGVAAPVTRRPAARRPREPTVRPAAPRAVAAHARSACVWPGPPEIRDRIVALRGEAYAISYLDPAAWLDREGHDPRIVPRTGAAEQRLRRDLRELFDAMGVGVAARAA